MWGSQKGAQYSKSGSTSCLYDTSLRRVGQVLKFVIVVGASLSNTYFATTLPHSLDVVWTQGSQNDFRECQNVDGYNEQ